jgi:nucleoid-associated protein YgaU
MRKGRLLPILFIIVIAVVAFYGLRSGWLDRDRGIERNVAQSPEQPPAGDKPAKAGKRPTFDIVRAEPDGTVVMAGQSEPGWTVVIEDNGEEIGRATADSFGEWVLEGGAALEKGEHSIELSAKSPDGARTMFSTQRLALSLSEGSAGQPLVALTEEGKPTRVLQMAQGTAAPAAAPAPAPASERGLAATQPAVPFADNAPITSPYQAPAPADAASVTKGASMIGFASVDYEESGEKSMLFMNGHATPDSRVALYADRVHLGTVTADATGRWSYAGNRQLAGGRHDMRADLLKPGSDTRETVAARAEVRFETAPPTATAALEEGVKPDFDTRTEPSGTAAIKPGTAGKTAAGEDATASRRDPGVIVVRRGDTLWQIAQRYYGDGKKYTQIFKNNRGQIRDPNWIYPDQRVQLPAGQQ